MKLALASLFVSSAAAFSLNMKAGKMIRCQITSPLDDMGCLFWIVNRASDPGSNIDELCLESVVPSISIGEGREGFI